MTMFNAPKPNARPFRAMLESGHLVNEVAEVVETQVIAERSGTSIRDRDTVPFYRQKEEGYEPSWYANGLVETGLSPPPGMDSRYNLEDARDVHNGIRYETVETAGESVLQSNTVVITVGVVVAIAVMGCMWIAGQNLRPDAPTEAAQQQEVPESGSVDDPDPDVDQSAGPGAGGDLDAEGANRQGEGAPDRSAEPSQPVGPGADATTPGKDPPDPGPDTG